jgi:hypothetical protein
LVTGKRNGHALPAPRPEPQGPIQAFKAWPRWGKALLPAAVLVVVIGMAAALSAEPPVADNQTAAPAFTPTQPTTTTVPPTTVSTAAAIAPTTVPPATAPTTTPSTTPPATEATTPPSTQAPPDGRPNQQHQSPWSDDDDDDDHGPSTDIGVRAGAYCSPEGATGISHHGVPMTCAMQSCDGHRFDQPHWRKADC